MVPAQNSNAGIIIMIIAIETSHTDATMVNHRLPSGNNVFVISIYFIPSTLNPSTIAAADTPIIPIAINPIVHQLNHFIAFMSAMR